jgi:methylated-DNA-[protein]-cysteine S-methyltransferase
MKGFPKHALASRLIQSPVGNLVLLVSARGLAGLFFGHRVEAEELPADDSSNRYLNAAENQLEEYFARRRKKFDLPLDVGGTEFQRAVWKQLSRIPFGETRSYGEIAAQIGNPKSVRAVGAANGSNPISVIVPCHRVIGADGALTGFGGGLDLKRSLLEFEGVLLAMGEG